MSDHLTRARLAHLQVQRLHDEAKRCDDAARLRAIRGELEVILESLRLIREEQLIAELSPAPAKRHWWRLGR